MSVGQARTRGSSTIRCPPFPCFGSSWRARGRRRISTAASPSPGRPVPGCSAPGNANNALKLLRQILDFAVARGHLDANPARDIRPNRRPRMTRFLSGEGGRAQADIIRLLLLTGCRRNEIVRLRWSEVRGDTLVLGDSKTGPRRVPSTARPGAFSSPGRVQKARSCSRRRATRPGRAARTSGSGTGSGAGRGSRTCGSMTCVIRTPAMR